MIKDSSGIPVSKKKYGTAVSLSAIFGVLGIHHFYLGRPLVGLFDLGLTAAFVYFFFTGQILLGIFFLVADLVHTLVVTIQLLIGAARDGDGALVAYPGQFKGS